MFINSAIYFSYIEAVLYYDYNYYDIVEVLIPPQNYYTMVIEFNYDYILLLVDTFLFRYWECLWADHSFRCIYVYSYFRLIPYFHYCVQNKFDLNMIKKWYWLKYEQYILQSNYSIQRPTQSNLIIRIVKFIRHLRYIYSIYTNYFTSVRTLNHRINSWHNTYGPNSTRLLSWLTGNHMIYFFIKLIDIMRWHKTGILKDIFAVNKYIDICTSRCWIYYLPISKTYLSLLLYSWLQTKSYTAQSRIKLIASIDMYRQLDAAVSTELDYFTLSAMYIGDEQRVYLSFLNVFLTLYLEFHVIYNWKFYY